MERAFPTGLSHAHTHAHTRAKYLKKISNICTTLGSDLTPVEPK